MRIGLPRALLYYKYYVFVQTFFEALGAQVVVSPRTNKQIHAAGLKTCVDEACLPIKVFHGHAQWLARRCDFILIPRILGKKNARLACPMICGLKEMAVNSVHGLPPVIEEPVLCFDERTLYKWARNAGRFAGANRIDSAFYAAVQKQKAYNPAINQRGCPYTIALIGHMYNIEDSFVNHNLIKKLNALGMGIITAECVSAEHIEAEAARLFKRPFWYFARQYYGSAAHIARNKLADGIIYVSAFCCGVDSVVVEMIKSALEGFPFMVLKIDEHTGEAGFDTRIEAFADMIKRRAAFGNNISAYG
ncbi:MAG: acyl-CoA dehydratase activase-related protein [Christensenellales bacterium]